MSDTIYALSTPVGGAIAVIRLSGPDSLHIMKSVFTGRAEPRYAAYGHIKNGSATLDEAVATYFKAPESYTGEDMAEFSIHGGRAAVAAVTDTLARYARCAQPGEFTKRAFLNGKIDLSQAEAVMDMINANAEMSRKAAMDQLSGTLYDRILNIENSLIEALAGLNAAIDYPEELEEDVFSHLPTVIAETANTLTDMVDEGLRARVLREGALVAIAGRPNAGKSSLLNAILNEERAIVTDVAGTTRDIIEEQTVIAGVPVRIADTAGIRETPDDVERIGVQRARALISRAELVLLTFDGSETLSAQDDAIVELTADRPRLAVLCKQDAAQVTAESDVLSRYRLPAIGVSALTGEGMDRLKSEVAVRVAAFESALVTNTRHIEALRCARDALLEAAGQTEADCIATDMRDALNHLGAITGRVVDEAVIDRIFSRFCVGK